MAAPRSGAVGDEVVEQGEHVAVGGAVGGGREPEREGGVEGVEHAAVGGRVGVAAVAGDLSAAPAETRAALWGLEGLGVSLAEPAEALWSSNARAPPMGGGAEFRAASRAPLMRCQARPGSRVTPVPRIWDRWDVRRELFCSRPDSPSSHASDFRC